MDNSTENALIRYIKGHKGIFVIIAIAAMVLVSVTIALAVFKWREAKIIEDALEEFTDEQIHELETDLAEEHDNLIKTNTDYEAEMTARENDRKLHNEKVAELESEKERLLAELNVAKNELEKMMPPELDVKEIVGMYEGKGELSTLIYNYEVQIESKTEDFFTGKRLLYMIPGTMKIGVNFDQVKNGISVDDRTKTVTLTIPAAYFIANEIDEANVERYDIDRGLFSKVEDKDYLAVAEDAKQKVQQQVFDNGMLVYAQKLAGFEFINLLEPITSKSGYEIAVVY